MIDLHLYAFADHGLTLSVGADARPDRIAYIQRFYPTIPTPPSHNFLSCYLPGVTLVDFLKECRGGFVNVLVGS